MSYSDQELETLLDDIESDFSECKETWKGDAPDKGRQAICAFANDLPDHRKPGVLFVGVKAEAMKVLGFVQRFGVGIQMARAELKKNGNPDLEFQIEPMMVLATIRRRP